MANEDWVQYRIAILQTLERIDLDIKKLKADAVKQQIENNNQKWINKILIGVFSLGGGVASNFIIKIMGFL